MQPDKTLFVIDCISNAGAGTEDQSLLQMNQLHQRGMALELLVLSNFPWLAQANLPWPLTVLGSASVKNLAVWFRSWRLGRRW